MCVFFTQTPIQESLILYNDPEIKELSIQCFTSECTHNNTWYYTLKRFFSVLSSSTHLSVLSDMMEYMGDMPMRKNSSQPECLRQILLVSAYSNSFCKLG